MFLIPQIDFTSSALFFGENLCLNPASLIILFLNITATNIQGEEM